MIRAAVAALVVVLLCAVAVADGGMFTRVRRDPATALTPTVRTPDQRALLIETWQGPPRHDSLDGIAWGGPEYGTEPRVTMDAARAAIAAAMAARRLDPADVLPIERDSPGNYTLTDEGGRIAFRTYGSDGSPAEPRFIERIEADWETQSDGTRRRRRVRPVNPDHPR